MSEHDTASRNDDHLDHMAEQVAEVMGDLTLEELDEVVRRARRIVASSRLQVEQRQAEQSARRDENRFDRMMGES